MKKKLQALQCIFAFAFAIMGVIGFGGSEAKAAGGISAVKVLDTDTVRVELSDERSLTATDVEISVKEEEKDTYKTTLDIERVEKVGSKVYDVILKMNDNEGQYTRGLYYGNFALVKIGDSSKETVVYDENKPKITYFAGVTGKSHSEKISFEKYTKGSCKYSISTLPKGIKAKKYDNYVVLSGKPKSVLNGKKVTVTATDTYGKKVKRTVLFYVGSGSKIVAFSKREKENNTVLTGNGEKERFSITVVGGRGDYGYKLKMTNKVSGVSFKGTSALISDGYFDVSDKISSGNHTVKYTVTDTRGKKTSSSVKFTVKKAVKLTVSLKTKDNKSIDNQSVKFEYRDRDNKYGLSDSDINCDESKSNTYTAYVAPDMSYSLNVRIISNQKFDTFYHCASVDGKAKNVDITLPLYRVSLNASDNSSLSAVRWCMGDKFDSSYGNIIGEGSALYLTEGEYKITGIDASSDYRYDPLNYQYHEKQYGAAFTVKESTSAVVNVTDPKTPDILEENVYGDVEISLRGNISKFTPSKTGPYLFRVKDAGEDRSINLVLYSTSSLTGGVFKINITSMGSHCIPVSLIKGYTYYLVSQTTEKYEDGSRISVEFEQMPFITADESMQVSVEGYETGYCAFIPPVTGRYTLHASNISNYVLLSFHNPYNAIISSNHGTEETCAVLSSNEELIAGQMYYVVFGADAPDVSLTLSISLDERQQQK